MLNCDMGETEFVDKLGHDLKCLDFVQMANIACGGHAGSDEVMIEVLKSCKIKSVLPGAHPSYPDRDNFGRTTIPATMDDIRHWTHEQVHRLAQHASAIGVKLHHVKPHGALYHDTMNNATIAEAFIQGVLSALNEICVDTTKNPTITQESRNSVSSKANYGALDSRESTNTRDLQKPLSNQKISIVGQSGSKLEQVCIREGLSFLSEAFADRKYLPNGALQSRSIPDSVLNTEQAVAQMKSMIETGKVISTDGPIPIRFDTVCVHGDSPEAISILQSIRQL